MIASVSSKARSKFDDRELGLTSSSGTPIVVGCCLGASSVAVDTVLVSLRTLARPIDSLIVSGGVTPPNSGDLLEPCLSKTWLHS